jgi:DNA repair exonuclease SbcCD ATPase subunit
MTTKGQNRMSTTIPLSKATERLRDEIRAIKSEVDSIEPAVQEMLSKDHADIDKVAERLAGLRAKGELLRAKLGRVKQSCIVSLTADVRAELASIEKSIADAQEQLRDDQEAWKNSVRGLHDKSGAKKILDDKSLVPQVLKADKNRIAELGKMHAEVETMLMGLDPVLWQSKQGSAIPMCGQQRVFISKAGSIIPELQ